MTPLIGILGGIDDNATLTLQNTYTRAIESTGGLPLIIPYTDNSEVLGAYAELCDGFLFSGGCDVEPKKFGEETKKSCGDIQLLRDSLELSIFEGAFKHKKPIMGICRGVQLINVALGGTLYQDIPTEIPSEILHRQTEPKNLPSHSVKLLSGTPLMELIGKERMAANSFHHQSVKALGEGLEVMALADDGIIEAIYYTKDSYVMGYQWHPERLFDADTDNRILFEDFILACKKSKI